MEKRPLTISVSKLSTIIKQRNLKISLSCDIRTGSKWRLIRHKTCPHHL
jgi:hypothetical protein